MNFRAPCPGRRSQHPEQCWLLQTSGAVTFAGCGGCQPGKRGVPSCAQGPLSAMQNPSLTQNPPLMHTAAPSRPGLFPGDSRRARGQLRGGWMAAAAELVGWKMSFKRKKALHTPTFPSTSGKAGHGRRRPCLITTNNLPCFYLVPL